MYTSIKIFYTLLSISLVTLNMYYYQHLLCNVAKDFARIEQTKDRTAFRLRGKSQKPTQQKHLQHLNSINEDTQHDHEENIQIYRNMKQPEQLQHNVLNLIQQQQFKKERMQRPFQRVGKHFKKDDEIKVRNTEEVQSTRQPSIVRTKTEQSEIKILQHQSQNKEPQDILEVKQNSTKPQFAPQPITSKQPQQSDMKIVFKSSQEQQEHHPAAQPTVELSQHQSEEHQNKRKEVETVQPEASKSELASCERRKPIQKDGHISINRTSPSSFHKIYSNLPTDVKQSLQKGGLHRPTTCKPKCTTAIVIPYKARENQLKTFLRHMHPILHRSQIGYRIFVIEQNDTHPFNRAKLFNVGFQEAITSYSRDQFSCFVFHDVDLLLENEFNNYCCKDSPRYMCPAIDIWGYRSFSPYSFGGVVGLTESDFKKVNGYSNKYWGWGSEDDDLHWRLRHSKKQINRPPMTEGRYSMLTHKKQARNGKAILMLKKTEKGVLDLHENGLTTLEYKVKRVEENKLFTHIFVDLKMTHAERNLTDVSGT